MRLLAGIALAGVLLAADLSSALGAAPPRLQDLTLEELANLEVTTPGKVPESAFTTPAAVYVLTQDDLRRSGATNIPEALRLVPGVEVARIDSYKWAIGIRGFGTRLSKGVLVLIDGRSVYTPLFAGVYWEAQDVPLQDVERVEIIRGPGATIWGSNSLNGVINIVTRPAAQTQGWRATILGGNVDQGLLSVRYGGGHPEGGFHYRAYVKGLQRGPQWHPDASRFDRGQVGGAGFRADWTRTSDALSLQAEIYGGPVGNRLAISSYDPPSISSVEGDADLRGGHLLAHWNRRMKGGSELRVQGYYDRTERNDLNFSEARDTWDLDFVHRLPRGRHRITWGLGARASRGDTDPVVPTVLFTPEAATDRTYSGFLQDEIALGEQFALTLGAKVLDHNLSGSEAQPSLRLAFTPSPQLTFWAAATRAVRTPSRVDTDLRYTALLTPAVPLFLRLTGERGRFGPEEVIGYEAGYNQVLGQNLSWSVAAFYSGYDDVLGIQVNPPVAESDPPPPHAVVLVPFGNELRGRTKGVEVAPTWNAASWLRFKAAYSYLAIEMVSKPGHNDPTTIAQVEGNSPKHRWIFQSLVDLPHAMEVDLTYRRVSALPYQEAPAYDTADLGFTWGASTSLSFSVVGQNLFDAHHKEFGSDGGPDVEVRRSYYARITFRR